MALAGQFSVLAWLAAAPLAAQAANRDTLGLRPAFRLIDRFVAQKMQAANTPGLALALVDRAGLLTVRCYGYADLERRIPVNQATRFQIGSISKSFTAIALLQLTAEGRFDPRRPVREYLPWFTPASPWRPVTGHDLLTHTAGLPADRDDIPSSPAQGYAVRERTLGSAPGSRWAYSNIGYQVLGQLLEAIDGRPYAESLRRRILEPVGMTATEALFTHETRLRLARGYRRLYDDRPGRPTDPLVPAEWIEYASGDGSLVSNAVDLGAYLTMLLNQGRGPRGALLSAEGFAALTRPYARTDRNGDRYGYGLLLGQLDARPVYWHSGGMLGYSSYLIGEPTLGVGVVALVNGPGSTDAVARFALRALSASMRGDSLPELRPQRSPISLEGPDQYAGTFRGEAGDSLVLAAAGDSLLLIRDGRRDPLEAYDTDAFLGPRPDFALFPIRFGRDSSGAVTEVWYGGRWLAGERYIGTRTAAAPKEWQGYVGHYRIMQPWQPNFRIVLRRGRLLWIGPDGDEEVLTAVGPRQFRVGDAGSAERLRFEDIVDGKALKAVFSGMAYYRFFTP
jgi:CubicO group peptidase (beta-lactamase class C family)